MAQRTQIVLIDDLDGTEMKDGNAQSITFSWSGVDYSIDLSRANADKFEKAIRPYLEKAQRVVDGRAGSPARRAHRAPRARSTPRRSGLGPHLTASSYPIEAVSPLTSSRSTGLLVN